MQDSELTGKAGEDPRVLLRLAQDRSVEGRKRLIGTIADVFTEKGGGLTERERALMSDILNKLVRDFEMGVRRELAERLAAKPAAPHDLIVALANDAIEVARPILLQSDVLRSPELVEIIHNRTREHQLAIAMRRSVEAIVSDALVETGDSDVIKTLLQNPRAEITNATLAYLVEEARRVDSYQEPLIQRRELSPDLARRMYWWVSAALRSHILRNFDIDPAELDDEIELVSAVQADQIGAAAGPEGSAARALAQRLAEQEELTPEILIRSLRRGEVALFEALFAELSGLTQPRLQRVLYDAEGKDLAVACRAMDMEKSHFSIIYLLSRRAQPGHEASDPRDVARIMSYFDRVKPEAAKQVLRHWRRDPGYLDAIDEIEGSRGGPTGP